MADNYETYSRDELLRLLRERDRKPRFGLVWERDEIEHDKILNNDFVALDLDPGLSCGNAPFENIIIEGDNFDALRYLRMTHSGRVKCIYIDPPYNTGNRDFIYNDRFVDKDDTYRHSKWLEFMYRRLTLAKDLLAEDGVIFVSIDDNELFHLGLLMEQVFGSTNFLACITWQRKYSVSNNFNGIATIVDYVLAYSVSTNFKNNLLPRTQESIGRYANPDNDERGPWKAVDYLNQASPELRPNLCYDIVNPNTGQIVANTKKAWKYELGTHRQHVVDNRIWWGKDGKNTAPALKLFLSDVRDGMTPHNWWPHEEVGHTDEAKKEIQEIFDGSIPFDTPKPTRLIERILRIATKPNDLVLDFFAGSGTTAHAIMKLNAEDGGKRRFILVSSTEATGDAPDKNLCRDVCAERVRRVAQGYTNKKGEAVEGLGGSFAYLRTKRIPVSRVFNDIQHEQVWRALQLMHGEALTKFDKKTAVHVSGNEDDRLVYVPKLSDAAVAEVARLAGLAGRLVVYSWQPGLIRQRNEAANVAFEKIPEFLVNRFGGMAR